MDAKGSSGSAPLRRYRDVRAVPYLPRQTLHNRQRKSRAQEPAHAATSLLPQLPPPHQAIQLTCSTGSGASSAATSVESISTMQSWDTREDDSDPAFHASETPEPPPSHLELEGLTVAMPTFSQLSTPQSQPSSPQSFHSDSSSEYN